MLNGKEFTSFIQKYHPGYTNLLGIVTVLETLMIYLHLKLKVEFYPILIGKI